MKTVSTGKVRTLSTAEMNDAILALRYDEVPLSDSCARTIAMWWQSSGYIGKTLAALASGLEVDVDELRRDIDMTRKINEESETEMMALASWLSHKIGA